MRALLLAVGTLLLSACGSGSLLLPDGGRDRQVCTPGHVVVPVRVLNAQGLPYESIDVTATHIGTGTVTTGKTDANGLSTIVSEDLGAGTIRVVAQLGAKSSTADVTMICGECQCSATPSTVTLTLQ